MDECDNASRIASFMDRVFLEARLRRATGTGPVTFTHCEECDEEIPEARRIAEPGCTLCVDCKAAKEGYAWRRAR